MNKIEKNHKTVFKCYILKGKRDELQSIALFKGSFYSFFVYIFR